MILEFFQTPVARTLVQRGCLTHGLMLKLLVAFAGMAGSVAMVHAQSRFEEDFDNENKPWQEIAIQLPAAPMAENLLPFYVSATATQSFAIDAKSLTVGADGVIRYTLL